MLEAILDHWVSSDRQLQAQVRCGLVLCIPFLRPALRASLAPELERLLQYAAEDDDAWVRILARALAGDHTRADLAAVAADVPTVRPFGVPPSLPCRLGPAPVLLNAPPRRGTVARLRRRWPHCKPLWPVVLLQRHATIALWR